MNILVTGANGQLGNEMRIVSKNTTDHYLFTDVNQVEGVETTYLDITDMDAIRKMVSENHIDAIINCAACTNVDACENDEKLAALAEKLNADAPENLALAMKETGGLLVQISTDYVFGKEPYNVPCDPSRRELLQAYMVQPSFTANRKSWQAVASMSSSAPHGSTLNLARTSARQCSTSQPQSHS